MCVAVWPVCFCVNKSTSAGFQSWNDDDVVQEMTAMELRQHHKEELRAQMAANEERQKRQHAEYLLEGEKTRQKLQAEKAFIEVRDPDCSCT